MSSPVFDAERRIVLACALASPDTDISRALAREFTRVSSWAALLHCAALHQCQAQLAAHLCTPGQAFPAAHDVKLRLDAVAGAIRGRGLLMAGELILALDALHTAGVAAVPFKGPGFAEIVGTGSGQREMGDLDLLVAPENIRDAVRALAALGYAANLPEPALGSRWLVQANHELGLVREADSMLIELHWQFGPSWFPAACRPDEVLPRLSPRTFFGRSLPWPSGEELLLMHVTDGMKSCGFGIRWIADLTRILRLHPELDWDRMRHIAARNGGLNTVRIAMAALEDITGEVASVTGIPALALGLPSPAKSLAQEARRQLRLSAAVRSIRSRIATDTRVTRATGHFLWALQVADHPARVASGIFRYLAGPAIMDLQGIPQAGESNLALRWRALRRRLGMAKR